MTCNKNGLDMITHNNQVTELNSSIETPLKVTLVTGKAMITVVFCCQLDPSQLETWWHCESEKCAQQPVEMHSKVHSLANRKDPIRVHIAQPMLRIRTNCSRKFALSTHSLDLAIWLPTSSGFLLFWKKILLQATGCRNAFQEFTGSLSMTRNQ